MDNVLSILVMSMLGSEKNMLATWKSTGYSIGTNSWRESLKIKLGWY
jgi:hypothetical protein